MESHVSVQKVNNWLCRVVWNPNCDINNSKFQKTYPPFSFSSKIDLTSLGIDECYKISCSMESSRCGYGCNPYLLYLTLLTSNENIDDFKTRKLTARLFGYEKEMALITNFAEFFSRKELNPSTVQSVDRGDKKIKLEWKATWAEITTIDCFKFCNSLAGNFEMLMEIRPKFLFKKELKFCLSDITHMWKSKTFADIKFKFEDRDIKAHSFIVSYGSPVLAAMFQYDFIEKQEKIAVIKEIDAEVFEKLLYFIYSGNIDVEFEDTATLIDLMVAADMYNIVSLKDKCEQYLSEHLTVENATTHLILAHLYDAKKLNNATLNYMHQNSEVICARPDWKNLLKDHLDLGFDAIQFIVMKSREIRQAKMKHKKMESSWEKTLYRYGPGRRFCY